MSIEALGGLIAGTLEFERLTGALKDSGRIERLHLIKEAEAAILAALRGTLHRPLLVVTPRPEEARNISEQMALWGADARLFPESEALPFERLTADAETVRARISTLASLLGDSKEASPIVVASISAISQKTTPRPDFEAACHTVATGDQIDIEDLLDRWLRMGYSSQTMVDVPGTVARRGGILDIFPAGASLPYRIELWGQEIDSIRTFDPGSQRSIERAGSFDITPAAETLPGFFDPEEAAEAIGAMDLSNLTPDQRERSLEEIDRLLDGYDIEEVNYYSGIFNTGCLLDYMPAETLTVAIRPDEITGAAWEIEERTIELRRVKEGRGELPGGFPSSHLTWAETEQRLAGATSRLEVMQWGTDDDSLHSLPVTSAESYYGNLDRFVSGAREMASGKARVVVVTSLPKRLIEVLTDAGVDAVLVDRIDSPPAAGVVTITSSSSSSAGLSAGFMLASEEGRLALFSDAEVFGVTKRRRTTQRRAQQRKDSLLAGLNPGDYVVHIEHGIGRFMGTGQPNEDAPESEYLVLEYSAGDRIYVPMGQLDRVSPYVAPMGRSPSLSRLGSQEWSRTKRRVEESTREMAGELLGLYATREAVVGHAFAPDSAWQLQLEDSFPYEETPDQVSAVAEVKDDMERTRPMDRLVCGDVGYGKTEIALRAAFKAVMDGRQVAVLVPTTVLAQQHYATFSQRLAAYPVRVEVLSRFRTGAEQREIVDNLASGRIDVCVGTHRLVQSDVRFSDLGLVIVDEEQRFGVAQKERLKQMRSEVDVLTLTATPIPRTLHMAMAGLRDMSTIMTPPEERLAVSTYVSEFSDSLIREAILRELDRQGQVYFLHNRVQSIDHMALYLRGIVPEATVGVAHGQMAEGQLERTMLSFADGEMDVLACTTIIESGLDIPNANTLIVNRADAFGLAQLYQLRGRVGRAARRAYAYLLIPPAQSLAEPAEKRLKTMLSATELGSGFRIAMADLEIRGAGNILGAQQSGHIQAVGFDLYSRMLAEATEQVRAQAAGGADASEGRVAPFRPDHQVASVDLGIPASLPESYVSDLPARMDLYRRLVEAASDDDVDTLEAELRDRFGPAPWQTQNLLLTVRIRVAATGTGIAAVTRADNRVVLLLRESTGGARAALQRHLGPGVEVGNTQVRLSPDNDTGWERGLMNVISSIGEFQTAIAERAAALS